MGTLVTEYLKEKGYGVNLLRIDKSNSYIFEDCYIRANQANEIAKVSAVELYVEIHINAGGGSGSEVCVTGKSEVANQYAAKISTSLSSALSLPNRGVKTRNLIVLNNTVMPAILVECLFADSYDADVYNSEVIARAIVNGLVGVDNSNDGEWKFGWNRNDVGWWYCNDTKNKYYYTSQNGWKEIDEEWYIFDSRGYALQNSWCYDEEIKSWYYLDSNCKMVRGNKGKPLWIWIDSGCYAFNEHGQMYCDCITPDGYRVGINGEWLEI
ncbi:N-acetylmuramoyl-L-alanine amidase [Clostridium chromiireducens]|uniref:N-acetylmuramoyl-L-alanine amidase n=1 Tax=Clostridium chromiireducens TaxID=225345 RepID=A0A964RL00_9CLOT|nr:N-acetylmuramoyl-L-alanine amidase [Clostridium chromiireducens]